MYLVSRLLSPRSLALLAPLALSLLPRPTQAQTVTWVGNRPGPALTEILTIDATGELNWPYGREDVAGDGLNTFTLPEQAIDARTVYVATDANRFYSRVYFSIPAAEPGNVTTFVFIDADQNTATGGIASGAELDLNATSTNSGYEYAIKVQRTANNTTVGSLWGYNTVTQAFTQIATQAPQIVTETNFALDPIRLGVPQDIHGYIQSSVELAQLGPMTQTCQASILVRTTNQTTSLGAGDLDVGTATNCVQPAAPNPVVVVPPPGCTTNAECPNGGICVNGDCVLAPACAVNADCGAGYICDVGRCVFVGGTQCVNSSNCDGLICQQGQCVVCLNDAACGAGFVCAPDGRCLAAGTGNIPCVNDSTCFGLLCQQGLCIACPDNAACGPGFLCADGRCYANVGAPCTNANTCNGLLCQAGRCVVCADNAACGPGFVCAPDGRCVAGLGTACTNSSTCNGFVCEGGQCVACANDAACGAGLTCGADGRCVTTTTTTTPSDAGVMYVAPGERLQGGACACRAVTGSRKGMLVLLSLLGTALLLGRHSKREREQ